MAAVSALILRSQANVITILKKIVPSKPTPISNQLAALAAALNLANDQFLEANKQERIA